MSDGYAVLPQSVRVSVFGVNGGDRERKNKAILPVVEFGMKTRRGRYCSFLMRPVR